MGCYEYGQAFSTGRSNPDGFPNQPSHQQCFQCLLSVEKCRAWRAAPSPGPCPGAPAAQCQQCPRSRHSHRLLLFWLHCWTFVKWHMVGYRGGLCPGMQRGQSCLVSFTGTSNLLTLPWSDGTCNFFLCCATFIIRCQWLSMNSCSVCCIDAPSSTSGDKQYH